MRKVIRNKVYDTVTSERICQTPQGYLYRKNSTLSFYIVSRKGDITPIKWNEAESLIHRYGTQEQYTKLFQPERYSDKTRAKQRITISISRDDYSVLRILAGNRGLSIGRYIHATVSERYKALEHRRKADREF